MKFSRARFSSPQGHEIVWRGGQSVNAFQLSASEGWDLTAEPLGLVALHASRAEPLFLPWALVGPCDVLGDAKGVKKAS
jgi:hypothetical protein